MNLEFKSLAYEFSNHIIMDKLDLFLQIGLQLWVLEVYYRSTNLVLLQHGYYVRQIRVFLYAFLTKIKIVKYCC